MSEKLECLELVNRKTGEIFDLSLATGATLPYRTILDADEYQDPEQYESDSSLTDLTGYEPLESVIARCMRTMRSPSGAVTQVLDVNALKAEAQDTGIYEAENAGSVDEAFETIDPSDAPGFSLADAGQILASVNDNIKRAELPTTQPKEQLAKKQATLDDAVDNSGDSDDMKEKPTAELSA